MKNYEFKSEKGSYGIRTLENIIVFTSNLIKGYTATINYPKDWGLTRVLQHIVDLEKNHTII